VKFNKLEFLKLLSHVLNIDLFSKKKERYQQHCCCENFVAFGALMYLRVARCQASHDFWGGKIAVRPGRR